MNHLKGFGVVRLKSSAQFKQKDSYRANKVLQSKQGSDCAMRCKQKYFKEMMTDIGNDPLTSFKFDKVIIYVTRECLKALKSLAIKTSENFNLALCFSWLLACAVLIY